MDTVVFVVLSATFGLELLDFSSERNAISAFPEQLTYAFDMVLLAASFKWLDVVDGS
jgi:hypothetical protein